MSNVVYRLLYNSCLWCPASRLTNVVLLWGPIWRQTVGIPKDHFSAFQASLLYVAGMSSLFLRPSSLLTYKSLLLSPTPQREGGLPHLFPKDSSAGALSSPVILFSGKWALHSACSTCASQVGLFLLVANSNFLTRCSQTLYVYRFLDLGPCGSQRLMRSQTSHRVYMASAKGKHRGP